MIGSVPIPWATRFMTGMQAEPARDQVGSRVEALGFISVANRVRWPAGLGDPHRDGVALGD
jgi:hypothetical protein